MKQIKKAGSLLLFVMLLQTLPAQIVNIESRRISTDTTGINGHADLNFFANKNKSTLYSLGTEAQIQYKTRKSLFLLLGNINFTSNTVIEFLNDGFLHFRYNYKIVPRIRWEAFTQLQYNRPLLIEQRFLLGTGPRIKLFEANTSRAYLGILAMYENERMLTGEKEQNNARGSTYFSWTLSKEKKISFTGTTYYQPLLTNFSDFRISGQYNFIFFLGQNLYLKNTLNGLYDSRPALNAVKTVYSFQAGLGYLLK